MGPYYFVITQSSAGITGRHYNCGMTMHERFLAHLQLCFVVSFVPRVSGLEEGGQGIGMNGWNIDLDAGCVPGKRTL